MEKLKEFYQENKKLVIGAGVATVAISAGAILLKGKKRIAYKDPTPLFFRWKHDPDFKKENISLYQTESIRRAELISDVKYNLFLSLAFKEGFNGRLITEFSINSEEFKDDEVFLDFQGQAIAEFEVNGESVPPKFERQRVFLPKDHLVNGKNRVSFIFKNTYVQNSAGLHWFSDPVDDKVYLFSHLEPFFCHRIFPCFDQPDIKAPLTLSVHCPSEEWVAIGNGKHLSKHSIDSPEAKCFIARNKLGDILRTQSGSLHFFSDSPLQSSYIYGFFIGSYHCFENTDPDSPTPMKLYVRQTMKDEIDPEERFRVITEGIKFYEDYFEYKFPFEKYDQIYCPEFRIGAMENVGAISFNENFLGKESELTSEAKTRHSYVALHELSHMWFGDLVTMKWWNDLWLKESFADYMSATCISSVSSLANYKNSECIFLKLKFSALEFDSRSTTHPILAQIKHTEDATSVFDQISYHKGASFIRLMSNMFGEEVNIS